MSQQVSPIDQTTKMDGQIPLKSKFIYGVVIFVFIASLFVTLLISSIHNIQEGSVGIYYVQGALDDQYSLPGIRFQKPFITEMNEIIIRPQTETMNDVKTVTRDGIRTTFHGIQVLSSVDESQLLDLIKKFGLEFRRVLIYDRVSEDLRLFCANHTIDEVYNTMFLDIVENVKHNVEQSIQRLGKNGMKILNLVIPKPDIPRDIATNYNAIKVQWTKQLVAVQQQKTEKILKETQSMKELLEAKGKKNVLEINLEKQLLEKQKEKERNDLDIKIVKDREENIADLEAYRKEKQADANKKLYSPDYIKLEMAKSLADNTKFYFSGENSALGSLLSKILT